jgi:hypothetical protein
VLTLSFVVHDPEETSHGCQSILGAYVIMALSVREIDVAHPSKRKGTGFELEVVKVLQGYAIEAVKIPLSGSVAGFAGDIGAVLTRQDISTNLQCGPSRRDRTGHTTGDR